MSQNNLWEQVSGSLLYVYCIVALEEGRRLKIKPPAPYYVLQKDQLPWWINIRRDVKNGLLDRTAGLFLIMAFFVRLKLSERPGRFG